LNDWLKKTHKLIFLSFILSTSLSIKTTHEYEGANPDRELRRTIAKRLLDYKKVIFLLEKRGADPKAQVSYDTFYDSKKKIQTFQKTSLQHIESQIQKLQKKAKAKSSKKNREAIRQRLRTRIQVRRKFFEAIRRKEERLEHQKIEPDLTDMGFIDGITTKGFTIEPPPKDHFCNIEY
jgi:hypothetical protein